MKNLKGIISEIVTEATDEPKETEALKKIRVKAHQLADEVEREIKNGAKSIVGKRPKGGPFLEKGNIGMAITSAEFCKRHLDKLIIELSDKLKITSIVVTHDMQSVAKVADRVVMLHNGRIIFSGSVDELYETDNEVVHQFIHGKAEGPIQPKPKLY